MNKQNNESQIDSEVSRYFSPDSISVDQEPRFVLITGPVCAGKTTERRNTYSKGVVTVDAAEIFNNLSNGELFDFPSILSDSMEAVGRRVAHRAIRDRRHIVTEIVGTDFAATKFLIEAMLLAGYRSDVIQISATLEVCQERNRVRSANNISSYYAESYNWKWLIAGVAEVVAASSAARC